MSKMEKIHYNLDPIDAKNAPINLIFGERSNGKSYQVKHKKAVEKYLKTHKRFILMRRWKEEIQTSNIEQYFQDVDVYKLTEGKYNSIIVYRKQLFLANYDTETNKTTRGEKIGYVVALSTEQNYAGASYLDVEDIIFEEFMARGAYLAKEASKLMNFYCTVDRKRGTTRLWLVGNSISRACPYIVDWELHDIVTHIKQGEIKMQKVESSENEFIPIAVEYCKSTGQSSHVIGKHKSMLNDGAWQTDPQPHLPKTRKDYECKFKICFFYQNFKFIGEYLRDIENRNETCWYIKPYKGEFDNKTLVFSDIIKVSRFWQRNIYDVTIKNPKIRAILDTFRESKVFYCDDLTGTDFKGVIDFVIKK